MILYFRVLHWSLNLNLKLINVQYTMRISGMNFKEMTMMKSQSKRYSCDILSIVYKQSLLFKCTIIVKKIRIQLAVQRNKIRRRIRFILQEIHKKYLLRFHIIIIINKPYKECSFELLRSKLNEFCKNGLKLC